MGKCQGGWILLLPTVHGIQSSHAGSAPSCHCARICWEAARRLPRSPISAFDKCRLLLVQLMGWERPPHRPPFTVCAICSRPVIPVILLINFLSFKLFASDFSPQALELIVLIFLRLIEWFVPLSSGTLQNWNLGWYNCHHFSFVLVAALTHFTSHWIIYQLCAMPRRCLIYAGWFTSAT